MVNRIFVGALFLCGVLLTVGCEEENRSFPVWHVEETHRWAELVETDSRDAGFQQVDSTTTGVPFVNRLSSETYTQNRHLVNGSGVAIGDVNGDGWPDLYFCRLEGANELYLNQGGFRFERKTAAGGAPLREEYSTGAALADVDGDRHLDLLVTTLGGPNLVFNNDGTGRFRAPDTLHTGRGSTTMALADLTGNGALDLYVTNYKRKTVKDVLPPEERRFDDVVVQNNGEYSVRESFQEYYEVERQGNRLRRFEPAEADRVYFNDGQGTFRVQDWRDVFRSGSRASSQDPPRDWGLVARLEDLNADGVPDLYVCNDFESPDYYYLGEEGASVLRAGRETALRTTSHSSMSIATTDVEQNGTTDFFVADMLGRTYERRHRQTGVRSPIPRSVDEETTRMQEMQNTFQFARGDGTFAEVAELSGVEATGWTWASTFVDVDLDGYEDLLATNGHAYDAMAADVQMRLANQRRPRGADWRDKLLEYPRLALRNVAFRNQGDGTFREQDDGWGLGEEPDVGHGLATGDLDRDGDQDVVINRLNQPAGLYRNEAGDARLAVTLAGTAPNTGGVGAQVRVEPTSGAIPAQEKSVIAGGEYVSDSEGLLSFAVGDGGADIRVRWPSGAETVVDAQAGRLYEIRHPEAEPNWERRAPGDSAATDGASEHAASSNQPEQVSSSQPTSREGSAAANEAPPSDTTAPDTTRLLRDVSDRLDHTHPETKYQDFERQPLLERRLSQNGPGAAWADLDGDGDDDLLIGAGRGGDLAYYRNDGEQGFTRVRGGAADRRFDRDATGIVTIPREDGATVFIGRSNYERQPDDPARPSKILRFEADAQGLRRTGDLTVGDAAVGPLALADVDQDGDLDLFVGGRHASGQYPESVSSVLFVNENGEFQKDQSRSRPFRNLGMVSGASFADLNGNGAPDLVLATEWGPIALFENQGDGRFVDRTEKWGLAAYTGFWNGVDVGDVNGDGTLDLVATNWGWNSKYGQPPGAPRDPETPQLADPIRVYYGDFDRNGIMDLFETHYHPDRDEYVPYAGLSRVGKAMPHVRRQVTSFEEYAQSSLSEIVGERRFQQAEMKEATTLSHMVFLNEGGQFEGAPLPWWAQLTASFSPALADFDGDGHQDILLSQNFFATQVKTPRQDGGRALWLRGDGTGAFTPVKGHESGLLVYGEQRAAPIADYDQDGRIDVLVGQNGATTKLFRNVGATPGVRVRLAGTSGNRRGVGATVRLQFDDGTQGPATVVSAGTSYWSQHSLTPVLGVGNRDVQSVNVTWPDGTTTERSIEADARSVVVRHPDRRE